MERSTPHFTVSVSLRCPQETVLPTLSPRVLQGAAVSGERIYQGPPRNVVRRVSERSVQTHPDGSLFQDVVLTAQIHINPETSLERLVPLVEFLAAWELLPNISSWFLQTIEKGYQYSSGLALPGSWGCCPPRWPPSRFW